MFDLITYRHVIWDPLGILSVWSLVFGLWSLVLLGSWFLGIHSVFRFSLQTAVYSSSLNVKSVHSVSGADVLVFHRLLSRSMMILNLLYSEGFQSSNSQEERFVDHRYRHC